MPTYEYRCPVCGAKTDRQRAVEDRDHSVRCPKDGYPMVRVQTPVNFTVTGYSAKNGYSS